MTGAAGGPDGIDGIDGIDAMVRVDATTFRMGSDHHYPEERPAHDVAVDTFWIDRAPVTNRDFARFVADTGYVTAAELAPDPQQYPGARPELLVAGSSVFVQPTSPVPLDDPLQWWRFVPGAAWRRPAGAGSTVDGLDDHPVVHIAYEDALAYATWAGKVLPTEAEWECAARSGATDTEFAWGDEFMPDGRVMANTWHGAFPHARDAAHPYDRTSPVGAFGADARGLVDMIGNVWEWTTDPYAPGHLPAPPGPPPAACCGPVRAAPASATRVIKGGSHLCAPNYCRRYRPAARYAQAVDTSTSHLGFRCVLRP
jgi:sulfatase modifying factor 1